MINRKFKKVVSKKTKKNERIEVLDFEETTKYEKRKSKLKFHIKNKFGFSFVCLVMVVILLTSTSLITGKNVVSVGVKKVLNGLGIYTEEIKNVEIQSDDYNSPGSWHIDKSAKWIENNKARVTFDVKSVMKTDGRYKDVILVLDVSGSMSGEKLEKAKSDSKELVDYLLSDSHNRVAIITFESTSNIDSSFSNKKEDLLTKIDTISAAGNTNYNAALQNVDVVMNGYVKENNRDIVTLFLTDGYPNVEIPNQVGMYAALKDKYSYMTINGVQYEMGTDIIEEIKQITDSQWVANQSTLNNVLFDASVSPFVYEDFIVTDYIHGDYFEINSVDDINVTRGTVKIEEESGIQKIIWNLGHNSFMTGASAQMEIVVTQKEQYVGSEGFYPTNKKESVVFSFSEGNEETVNSNNTPVLQNNFEVIYDTNTPEGCALAPITKETHFIYQNVTKNLTKLSCDGYLFKGWDFDEEDAQDIKKVNDDVFIMPGHDVTIRATWTKQAITKTMDGMVYEKPTLYKVLQNEAKKGTYAKEYTGEHQDSENASKSTEKIYHWYTSSYNDTTKGTAILDKNNVIFAGQCWQMIRTTDTGGVKMIYNGEAENGKCLNTRGTHVGYSSRTSTSLSSNYWYGTDYTYDATAKTFTLAGNKEQAVWNDTTFSNLIGKYTCKMAAEDGSCSTLYLVESYYNAYMGYVIPLDSNSHYSQFGKLQFNVDYGSPTYVGYMYGDVYSYSTTIGTSYQYFTQTSSMLHSTSIATSYWFADEIELDPSTGDYSLVNPYQVSDTAEYSSLVGKYTFVSSSQTYSSGMVGYIAAVNNTTMYYKTLGNKNLLSTYNPVQFGDSITDNGDGTYTITNPKEVTLAEWYTDYANYKNQYTCGDSSTTCVSPSYTTATTSTNYTYINAGEKILIAKGRNGLNLTDTVLVRKDELTINFSNYSDYKYTCNTTSNVCTESTLRMIVSYTKIGYNYASNHYWGSSVIWDGTNYTLVDPIEIENYNNLDNLSTHHYICPSYGEKKCSSVGYVYYYSGAYSMYYITLKNGMTSVKQALEDMLMKNTTNSIIKTGIDAWYKKYLLGYDDYLEDTIFCNDRSMPQHKDQFGWNPNGGRTSHQLFFKESSNDLSCENVTDRFSISNEQAKLTYKVGLMSNPEMSILNNSITRKTGQYYWLISPSGFGYYDAFGRYVDPDGSQSFYDIDSVYGVRPSISLKPDIEYADGDGSMEHPYIVE